MDKKVLSIVIPVYNAEKYVDRLLNDFVKQSLEKVEIILIDDGSKDNSLGICNEYAKMSESVVVFHQENQGASAARNKGIALAKGKYIVFVDSDDSISGDYVENICSVCEQEQADLIQFDAYIKKSEEISQRKCKLKEGYAKLEDYYYHVLNQEVNEPWDKAYKADIIHANSIYFDTQMTIGEDISMTLSFLMHANTVYIHHSANYCYERNEAGICANAKLKHLDDMESLYQNMKDFIEKMNLNEEIEYATDSTMLKGIFRTVGLIVSNGENKKEVSKKLNVLESVKQLLQKKYAEKSVEIRKLLLCIRSYSAIAWMVGIKNKR